MINDMTLVWSIPAAIGSQDGPPLAGTPGGVSQGADGSTGGAAPNAPASNDGSFIFMLIIPLVLVMLFFSVFGQRREKKRRAQMLGGIKKHDTVRTIGGVIGAVVEVKPETVVLKVDESSNIRMTFARDAIQQIIDVDERSSADSETEDNQTPA
jgi:preprotein translocase subunit YajC